MRERPIHKALSLAVLLLALLLPATAAQAGGKRPSLASTAQYKAFVEYVKKLDGLVGQPASAGQKETYEAELTTKKEAAAHKANALFKRGSEEAEAEATEKFKEQSAAIHAKEEEAQAALQDEFRGKVERAITGYREKLERVENGRHVFEAATHEKIDALRAKKAASADPGQKEAIQGQITALIAQISAKRQEAKEKRAALKGALGKQKEEIHAAEAKKGAAIGEEAEAKIEKSSKHWKKVASEKEATLEAKRDSQQGYLSSKLEKGRADIAAMPAA
jgi:hypothetical protein